jgi:hypothetical protein
LKFEKKIPMSTTMGITLSQLDRFRFGVPPLGGGCDRSEGGGGGGGRFPLGLVGDLRTGGGGASSKTPGGGDGEPLGLVGDIRVGGGGGGGGTSNAAISASSSTSVDP